MNETSERDAVLAEFEYDALNHHRLWGVAAMADEIVRLRHRANRAERILAALREPSAVVVEVVAWVASTDEKTATNAIRCAVAAAEREVDA